MSTTRQEAKTFAGSYAFSPPNMFAFLKALLERGCLPKSEAWRVIGIHTEDSYRQYESFLRSGGFVEADDSQVWPTAALKTLWQSLVGAFLPSHSTIDRGDKLLSDKRLERGRCATATPAPDGSVAHTRRRG